MEDFILKRESQLKFVYCSDISDNNINNMNIERKNRTKIRKWNNKEKRIIKNWIHETNRDDFNLIYLKIKGENYIFPLLSTKDYREWYKFKNNELNKLYKVHKDGL